MLIQAVTKRKQDDDGDTDGCKSPMKKKKC